MASTEAILLRRTRLTESSLIVSWFTRASGRVKSVAKGALRPKSPFRGKLDLFYRCDILCVPQRSGDLHTLRDLVLLEGFEGIRRTYPRLAVAGYFAELLELCTEPGHPEPGLFDLLLRALRFLDNHDPTRRAVAHFEAELCKALGQHDGRVGGQTGFHLLAAQHPQLPGRRREMEKCFGPANFSAQACPGATSG